jgi:hypothetical protein
MPGGRYVIFLKSDFVPVLNSGKSFGDADGDDWAEGAGSELHDSTNSAVI